MLTIKLFVTVIYLNYVVCSKYCQICPNHTLCKFPISGPSINCEDYQSVLFDSEDVIEIVNRINEKRNFIAMGNSRYFPQAANMNKVTWSTELAKSAQRWADQCDRTVTSEREDECRDLENVEVGQCIATIVGAGKRIHLKNFIDMWFIQSFAYLGSVTFYNETRESKTKYFTQLLWASTRNVGCGRARFTVNMKPVDRLVCNFSPKGNIRRRPIYTIGFPTTQCEKGTISDAEYPGLCSDFITDETSTTGFLRILYSIASKIDPVENIEHLLKEDDTQTQKSQKIRHVYNNSYALKRDNPKLWEEPPNTSRKNDGTFHHMERGHSRLYHNHDHTHQLDYLHPNQNVKYNRRFDYTMPSTEDYSSVEYRRSKQTNQCTRKYESTYIYDTTKQNCVSGNSPVKRCTRGQRNICNPVQDGCYSCSQCWEETQTPCFCTSKATCVTNPSQCFQNNINCKCSSDNHVNLCPEMRRNLNIIEGKTTGIYDDSEIDARRVHFKSRDTQKYPFLNINDESWKLKIRSQNPPIIQNTKTLHQLGYRKRRDNLEPMTFKPFWQEDKFNTQRQLKSMRYTTLPQRKTRKGKPMAPSSQKVVTEPITINIASKIKHPTEKYLSFEELLRLRKLNASLYNARRSDDVTTVAPASETEQTTEYTANTPFIRLKHCTRKLTCTWTAASAGDNEGNADIANRGSRTPPGYVEGCTRTSTCTRDYMNRNKMDTLPTPSTESVEDDNNDEDYCEKRSLNVRMRDLNGREVSTLSPVSSTKVKRDDADDGAIDYYDHYRRKDNFENCRCDNDETDYLRNKRENNKRDWLAHRRNRLKREAGVEALSYSELFYLVLRKIIGKGYIKMNHQCICNSVLTRRCNFKFIFILVFIYKQLM